MTKVIETLRKINNYMKSNGISGSVLYRGETSHLLRCGNSQVSLNVSELGSRFFVRLQDGKRTITGSVVCCAENFEMPQKLIDSLNENIKLMPELPFLKPMKPIAKGPIVNDKFDPAVENIDNSIMLEVYTKAVERFKNAPAIVSGAFSAGASEYCVINTLSDEPLYNKCSDYSVEVVLQLPDDDKKELRAACVGERIETLNIDKMLDELAFDLKVKQTTKREDLTPGDYDVIFSAEGYSDLIMFLYYLAISGDAYEFEMGMLQKDKHKIGTKIFGDNFTLIDDPNDPDNQYPRRFGFNGVARDKFPIIDHGVLKNLYYGDKLTCDRFDKEMNNDMGASNPKLFAGEGPNNLDEIIKSCDRPTLFIPFIHYMNVTNAAKGEITGTSRFGTWLIENGKIKSHLYKVRINDSLHRIFNNIDWLSSEYIQVNTSSTYGLRNAGSLCCPKFIKIKGLKITGTANVSV